MRPDLLSLALLTCLLGCGALPGDDDDSAAGDDDDSGSDGGDDADSFSNLVNEPGSVRMFLASAGGAGVTFAEELELPLVGLRVEECPENGGSIWHDIPIDVDDAPDFRTEVSLPPLPEGANLCGLEVTFEETLEVPGSFEREGEPPQLFVTLLNLDVLTFSFTSSVVAPDVPIDFLVQLAQTNWISPEQIGVPPEPKRGKAVVIDEDHPAYNTCIQQMERFSHVFLDLDGDGDIGVPELSFLGGQGPQLPSTDGPRFAALGGSRCLDENRVEQESCQDAEFYAPLIYASRDFGESWFLAETPTMDAPSQLRAGGYLDGLFLAVGGFDSDIDGAVDKGIVLSSVDAQEWGAWVVESPLVGIASGEVGNPWAVVGADGTTYRSRNGLFWEQNSSATSQIEFQAVAWSSAGLYVAVGNGGDWAWSLEGSEWSPETGLPHPSGLGGANLLAVEAGSEGKMVAVGESGAWLVLENTSEFATGLESPLWTSHNVNFGPDLTGLAVYVDPLQGESAVAVSPLLSSPVFVTQAIGSAMVSLDPELTELTSGVHGATIAVINDSKFAMGGPSGLSSWLEGLSDTNAGSPHPDVNHPIDRVFVGGP